MSAFATILAPASYGTAIELGNATFRKKLLPIGSIQYQNRTLNFTREYLQGLVRAWRDGAYDAIPVQFADASNAHTLDPERTRGQVTSMELADDGLYVTAELSERGQQVLSEHPYIGVSARIVEQYARSDGKFYPAAVQHILATTDPRIPNLGSWQPVDMANETSITIDLSSYAFAGEPAPAASASPFEGLSDSELADLIDAMDEAGLLDVGSTTPEVPVHDPAYSAAAEQFDAAFSARAAADAAREAARAEFDAMDLIRPAVRSEDKMARIMARASAGLYDGRQADFTAEAASVEILLANGGHGPCGPADEFGRCSSRFHEAGCSHGVGVDWQASSPPRSTGEASLANLADELALDLTPRTVWGDVDGDEPSYEVPQATIELAHSLATDWNLLGDGPSRPQGLTARAGPPLSTYDAMYAEMGYELPAQPQPSLPGISELARSMGLK